MSDEPDKEPLLVLYDHGRGNNPPVLIGYYSPSDGAVYTDKGTPSQPKNDKGRRNKAHFQRVEAVLDHGYIPQEYAGYANRSDRRRFRFSFRKPNDWVPELREEEEDLVLDTT